MIFNNCQCWFFNEDFMKMNYILIFKGVLYLFVFAIFLLSLKYFGENNLIVKFEQVFGTKKITNIEKLNTEDRSVILKFDDSLNLRLNGDEYTFFLERMGKLENKTLKFQVDITYLKSGVIHNCITDIVYEEKSIYKPAISVGSSKRNVFMDCTSFFK